MNKALDITPSGGRLRPGNPSVIPLEINPENKQTGLNMQVRIKIDGNPVDRFMSDSFTYLFASTLQALMHGGYQERHTPFVGTSDSDKNIIVNITAYDGSLKIDFKDTYSFEYGKTGDHIWIYGVQGIPEANGMFLVDEKISDSAVKIVNLDGSDITTTGSYTSGGKFGTSGVRSNYLNKVNENNKGFYGVFNWRIKIGESGNTVSIQDFGMYKKIDLEHGSTDFTLITTDKPSSRFTMTCTFTNTSSSDISVKEYAIISNINEGLEKEENIGVSRDVRSEKVIPAGKTITVEMTPIIRLTPDTQDTETGGTNGGFVEPFMVALRKIGNNSYSKSRNNIFGLATPPGGASSMYNNTLKSSDFGIVLGTDNKFTSMTDAGILDRIAHGSGDGQLYHYGTDVRPLVIDDVNNKAHYDVMRLFGNEGSTAVTVKETALMANVNDGYDWGDPTIIARHALASADQITIQPGTIKPIIYRISVTA